MLYGGQIATVAAVSFNTYAPAASFASEAFADLFYRCGKARGAPLAHRSHAMSP